MAGLRQGNLTMDTSPSKNLDVAKISKQKEPLIADLQYENSKLKKINKALINRIENGLGNDRSAYAFFESAVILSEKVKERTIQLQKALKDLEKVNEELSAAKSEAEQANDSKTKFLAAVSHDLLQPMTAARLFISALQELKLKKEALRLIDSLNYSMENIEHLVTALVDISKLEAGVVVPDISTFNIESLLVNLASETIKQTTQNGLRFRFVPSTATVTTDSQLLARILRNLLSNAIRYTQKGDILLGCRRRSEGLLIQVWDTGIGIPEDELSNIFVEFRRLPSTLPNSNKGLGLGLAIVDKIARILEHKIFVESSINKGSVFSVFVPYGKEESKGNINPTASIIENSYVPPKDISILVIDNDESICEAMKNLLSNWGYQVVTATSINGANSDIVFQCNPDLVIVDYHLDNFETGVGAAEQLRARNCDSLPVLMVTADRSPELKQKVRALGYHLLYKPVKPHKLNSILRFLFTINN